MYTLLLALVLSAPGQCSCGPDCACLPGASCGSSGCIESLAVAALPTIDQGERLARTRRCPLVIWVGRRCPDGERLLSSCVHAYASAIQERDGPGCVCCQPTPSGWGEITWFPGTRFPLTALQSACGYAPSYRPDLPPLRMTGYYPFGGGGMGGCGAGGCGAGGCGVGMGGCGVGMGGCAGGACAGGSCGMAGGRGRRR